MLKSIHLVGFSVVLLLLVHGASLQDSLRKISFELLVLKRGSLPKGFDARINEIVTQFSDKQRQRNEMLFELTLPPPRSLDGKLQPQGLLTQVCKSLKIDQVNAGNVIFIAAADKIVAATDFRKALQPVRYAIHIASSLGLPVFTYVANAVGQLDHSTVMQQTAEHDTLCFRMEPTSWHIARAFADFLREFRWHKVTLVVSDSMAGAATFVQSLKDISDAWQRFTDPSAFKFQVTRVVTFRGIKRTLDLSKCRASADCFNRYSRVLYQLYNTEERVFIFYGMTSDLRLLVEKAKSLGLLHLFDREYVWLISPSGVTVGMNQNDFNAGLGALEVPGLFGFYYKEDLLKAVTVAANMWFEGMYKFKKRLLATRNYNNSAVLERMHPNFNCENRNDASHESYQPDRGLYWKYGREIFKLVHSSSYCYQCDNDETAEHIGFSADGAINTTKLVLVNSRVVKDSTHWFPVGTWSMSSRHSGGTRFNIDSVVWPGNSKKPPLGRPQKYRLRVATLKEDPFVVYRPLEGNRQCGETSLKCRVVMENATEYVWGGNLTELEEAARYEDNCCSGLSVDLLRELMKDLNFEADLFEVPDQKWGGWTTQGWNGLVRVLLERKADLVLTSLKITPNRSEQIDFSLPYHRTGITILVALREGAISTKAFLKPYDYPSWCLILVFSVHACGAALFLFEWLSPQGLDRGNVPPREHKFSLFRSLWLIWSMLFGAAVNADNPRGVASRFLGNIWALFALVFLASYTANLAAFMIAEESYYDLAGINDWRLTKPGMHRPPFRFATVPSGATEENVKMNFPEMAKYMRNYSKSNLDEGIKALKNHEIDAFIYDATVLQFRVGKDKDCKLKTVGNWYSMTGYGVAFPKGSKWRSAIDRQVLVYRKNGQLERWSKYWFTGACQQSGKLRNTNQTLGVKNFISAFILLIGGMLLCCLLLGLEHWFYRYMRPRLKDFDRYGCCGLVSISMGQLLSFEQSVNQTVDLMKHHKCKNPICETQLWKLHHELDLAKRKIVKLESMLHPNPSVSWADQQRQGGNGGAAGPASNRPARGLGKRGSCDVRHGDYLHITHCSEQEIHRQLLPATTAAAAAAAATDAYAEDQTQKPNPEVPPPRLQVAVQQHHFGAAPIGRTSTKTRHHQPPRAFNSSYQLSNNSRQLSTAVQQQQQQQQQQRSSEILYKHPSIRSSPSTSAISQASSSQAGGSQHHHHLHHQHHQPLILSTPSPHPLNPTPAREEDMEQQTLVVKESVL